MTRSFGLGEPFLKDQATFQKNDNRALYARLGRRGIFSKK